MFSIFLLTIQLQVILATLLGSKANKTPTTTKELATSDKETTSRLGTLLGNNANKDSNDT